MRHLVGRTLRLATVAVAAASTLVLAAPTAGAARLGLDDALGDMWLVAEGSTEATSAPRARVGDFTRVTFRHTESRIVVKALFVELVPEGRRFRMWTDMRAGNGRETFALVQATPRDRDGRTRLLTGRGRDISCGMAHRIDYGRNLVRLSVPRACVGSPRAVRFRVASEYSRRNLRFARVDHPHDSGAPNLAWTRRVRTG
jgi:hypothetical protein